MNTAPPIAQASLLRILKYGLLNIRHYADCKNFGRCGIEANHLHNIPGLLENFSADLLKFYLDVEVPQYVRETNGQVLADIRSAWAELTGWLSRQGS
jgi:hypothetical protein